MVGAEFGSSSFQRFGDEFLGFLIVLLRAAEQAKIVYGFQCIWVVVTEL